MRNKIKTVLVSVALVSICFAFIYQFFNADEIYTIDNLQDNLESGSIQLDTDINYNDGYIVKSIVSFLKLIFDPIDSNDMVTIEKSNNKMFVNHSSPEHWSRVIGFEYENHTSPGYTSNSSEWLNNSNEIIFYKDDISIISSNPIYESMFCGRQWVIEIEGNNWYVDRFTEGNLSYTPLQINMELLL